MLRPDGVTRLAIVMVMLCLVPLACGGSAPEPSSTLSCGGTAIEKSGGGYWQCTFDEEFDGSTLDTTKWLPQQTATSGFTSGLTGCFVDSPNNISVANGVLSLTARREEAPFTCSGGPDGPFETEYTSGMVSTWERFSQAYGRFEIRAKMPDATVAGLHEALWLWPQDSKYGPWPASGEIDIAEVYGRHPNRAFPYVHYNPAAPDPNVTNTGCAIANIGDFHTYAVEWTSSTITFIYDGETCLAYTWNPASPLAKPQPFDQPFIVVLTQALGIGDNAFNPDATPLPATMQVDYVRVWE